MEDFMTGSEALYGFCGWLTTRDEITEMGASKDCAPIVELIKTFCDKNNLVEPRKNWEDCLTHPTEEDINFPT